MDPEAALAEIRSLTTELADRPAPLRDPATVDRLVELVDGLDRWLSNGGFAPKAWTALR